MHQDHVELTARPRLQYDHTLSQLLTAALELPPEARLAWVEALDHSHSELQPRLRALLTRSCDPANSQVLRTLPKLTQTGDPPCGFPAFIAGDQLGGFRLSHVLGAGAMGVVWLATEGTRQVALKLPRTGPLALQHHSRLARERELLSELDHPNIVKLIGHGKTQTALPYLVLEYAQGVDLREHCRLHAPQLSDRLALFRELARAVAHVHERGMVHRDLKPENLRVSAARCIKLLDFGIAKRACDRGALESSSGPALTPAYASPEQISGAPTDPRSDVFQLGVILYELLTGQRPFTSAQATRRQLRAAIVSAPFVPPSAHARSTCFDPQLWAALDALVCRSLQRAPAQRYHCAGAMLQALQDFAQQ